MFSDFEITVTGGFAIVTLAMWALLVIAVLILCYQSPPLRPLRKAVSSVRVLVVRKKTADMYRKLHANGYIYRWSRDLCLRRIGQ